MNWVQAISDYIAALDFFKNLPPDTRINVLRQCEYSVASENQVVFFQGETADLFYIILTGTVGVHVVDARCARDSFAQKTVNLFAQTIGVNLSTSLPPLPFRAAVLILEWILVI